MTWPALFALHGAQSDVQPQNTGCIEHVKKIFCRSLTCSYKDVLMKILYKFSL